MWQLWRRSQIVIYSQLPTNLVSSGLFCSSLLHVLLERRSGGDGLARIRIFKRFRITGIEHTSGTLLVFVVNGSRAHKGSRGRCESGGTGHKGGNNNQFGLYRVDKGIDGERIRWNRSSTKATQRFQCSDQILKVKTSLNTILIPLSSTWVNKERVCQFFLWVGHLRQTFCFKVTEICEKDMHVKSKSWTDQTSVKGVSTISIYHPIFLEVFISTWIIY